MLGYLWEAARCGVGLWLPGICVGPLGVLPAARVRDAWQWYFFAGAACQTEGLLRQGGQPAAVHAGVAGTTAGLVAAAWLHNTPVQRECCFLHFCKAAVLRDLGSASLPPSKTWADG